MAWLAPIPSSQSWLFELHYFDNNDIFMFWKTLHQLPISITWKLKLRWVPVSTSSPTNIFAIPDITIVMGIEIFWVPVTLVSNCIHRQGKCKDHKANKIIILRNNFVSVFWLEIDWMQNIITTKRETLLYVNHKPSFFSPVESDNIVLAFELCFR